MSVKTMLIEDWEFKASEGGRWLEARSDEREQNAHLEEQWLEAIVPGCVHTDLMRHGLIPDPFYGTNEDDVQWVDKQDWDYRATFNVAPSLYDEQQLAIVFDGLDTYADVYINGQHIIAADNMFRTWKADIKPFVKRTDNELLVRFRSPINEDLPKLAKLGYPLPATNDQSEVGGLGDKKVSIFARKAPYHYGWDWGPRLVTSGIWREVRLEGWSEVRITDLFIRQDEVTQEHAQLTALIEIESEADWAGTLRITVTDGSEWQREISVTAGVQTVELALDIDNPRLWWCRGLGEPHLYAFTATMVSHGQVIANKTVRTGLRAVRLVREKDEWGTSFYFELNGVPVFAKGANHIPNDSFLTDMTYERYRHEIASAVEANMNMLRVWGGGVYEDDRFYELCDEFGVLVWQDFMFACSMYPGDDEFLQSVRQEAVDNVRRLRNHPSIVLWCGNNEIDAAWAQYDEHGGWGWKKHYDQETRDKIWRDYEAIFHHLLPEVVSQYAPGMDYWPSSPMQDLTGDIHQHAGSDTPHGDIHYWGVWHNVEPFENYNVNIGRFMSEYGFQSFPEYRTVRTYAEEDDMALLSKVMLKHQKNGQGNSLIKQYMDMYLPEPKDFPSFLYMSQVLQAEAMKMAIEAHRRRKPFTMGTLYWQMNDCWPVASWSSIDYYGRWKATQYYARRSFADVIVSVDGRDEDEVAVYLVNDTLQAVGGELRMRLVHFSGKVLSERTVAVDVRANRAAVVHRFAHRDWLKGAGSGLIDAREVVLLLELVGEQERTYPVMYYFVTQKEMTLSKPAITISEIEGSEGTAFIVKSKDVLAKNVLLSSEVEGIFSDNFFDLLPGMPVTVQFMARNKERAQAAFIPATPGEIQVSSMADMIKG